MNNNLFYSNYRSFFPHLFINLLYLNYYSKLLITQIITQNY